MNIEQINTGDELSLEKLVVKLLTLNKLTITTAESCTGGLIASRITDVPGSSFVFHQGFITYSNEVKIRCLNVPPEIINNNGIISAEVALHMAKGALKLANADIAIATTGMVYTKEAEENQYNGTAWVSIFSNNFPSETFSKYFEFSRQHFKFAVCQAALFAVKNALQKYF